MLAYGSKELLNQRDGRDGWMIISLLFPSIHPSISLPLDVIDRRRRRRRLHQRTECHGLGFRV
jgi:hypothetical protein